ncbi:hypothetical protein P256_00555 [Acinetobacter nectaris CIP 110549]|uniref:DUF1615 domain-containing protein n=1 Tax=Acinetobacter nectaris CIP 110549 TaxID=1392540 RepID=V2TV90_9GAMM|nr:DUF1615 family protein [Acinetobacter nectaris]ESK40115.1 hypothetical protein P256_00555 [Acinetobacter nectaris CIP 110549]
MKNLYTFSRFPLSFILFLSLTACGSHSLLSQDDEDTVMNEKQIRHLVPSHVRQRDSWAQDINGIMDTLKIEKSRENVCSVVAIVDQESNFVANPQVPGLGDKAIREVHHRLEEKFTDKLGDKLGGAVAVYFQDVLKNQPTPENSYLKQMKKVKTEKDLDILYRQIFDYMTKHYHVSAITGVAKFVGQDIGERMNPITTLGSMQVQVSYAQEHERNNMNIYQLRDDLYTQYGGLYYGIHRLMLYPTEYSKPIYRFADYNSGMYSSRNAAFQQILEKLTGIDLSLDGDLLLYSKDGKPQATKSQSEIALTKLFNESGIVITPKKLRADLKEEKDQSFEKTQTYLAVQKLYTEKTGKKAPYAIMPEVIISGPKLSKDYNTNWYATRVNTRYDACMRRAKNLH